MSQRKFLTAEWRKLIMANYEIEPGILKKYIPTGTEPDTWSNKYYVSLVGFMFLKNQIAWHYYSIPFKLSGSEPAVLCPLQRRK